jgi:hypothetical protein
VVVQEQIVALLAALLCSLAPCADCHVLLLSLQVL